MAKQIRSLLDRSELGMSIVMQGDCAKEDACKITTVDQSRLLLKEFDWDKDC